MSNVLKSNKIKVLLGILLLPAVADTGEIPESPENIRPLLVGSKVPALTLSSTDNKTLLKYGKYGINLESASGEKHHLFPVPAVFLVNSEGTIQFKYINSNYKVRLKKEVIVVAAKAFLRSQPSYYHILRVIG